jgi:predicted kinase
LTNVVSAEQIYVVECICPEEIVIDRLKARKGDYSDADVEIYRKMKQLYEPVIEDERHIVIETSQDPKIKAEEIKRYIFGASRK